MNPRTSILISCSGQEAAATRARAKTRRQTLSGYVLSVVMRAVQFDDGLLAQYGALRTPLRLLRLRTLGANSVLHLRCSQKEAEQIKAAAGRRGMTVSGFVLMALRRSWNIQPLRDSQ